METNINRLINIILQDLKKEKLSKAEAKARLDQALSLPNSIQALALTIALDEYLNN